ncbi:MAG: NADH-quinone oxidoreductase subunit L [Cytophagaceae bacterium]|nr:NADH-quinone oxidoreductase subunit L [Cytophagaceae bacterium]MDW8457104.1 NADH-quinone oxidoreductase subunit L [Cytophagaceae bacterium]
MIFTLVAFILFVPLLVFSSLFFFGRVMNRYAPYLATGGMFLCFILSVIVTVENWKEVPILYSIHWFSIVSNEQNANPFVIGLLIDRTSSIMMSLVCLISLMVHLYSIEYMYEEQNHRRYFSYLNLFSASMLGIVLSDHLLLTFMCWELVGFSSYLLIGFWLEKKSAARAAKKAFIINRLADLGFIVALMIAYGEFQSFSISEISTTISSLHTSKIWVTALGVCILVACAGKSSLFPFQVWLPDAMEGPTPVSALLHAATMVAAGVYLLIKCNLMFNPFVQNLMLLIGLITTFSGALPAAVQTDIKKVLAYSTISQLGFMVVAIGLGAPHAAFFHLITHAFFKAALFLAAGAVINSMHHVKRSMFIRGYFNNFDTLDMNLMGGLSKKMPVTFMSYLIACLSIIGIPLTSGFLSKESILEASFVKASQYGLVYYTVSVLLMLAVGITAYYMSRQLFLVFMGRFKLGIQHPESMYGFHKLHDPGILMKIPLLVLSAFSLWIFYSPSPFHTHHSWIYEHTELPYHLLVSMSSLLAVALGMYLSYVSVYKLQFSSPSILIHNWYLDKVYEYLFLKPSLFVSNRLYVADKKIIDRIIEFVSVCTVVLSAIVGWMDKYILDNIISTMVCVVQWVGNKIKRAQEGTVMNFIYLALAALTIMLVYLLVFG